MATKPYHHGELRPALLSAVRDLVAEKGIESLSLRECARRAGVSWSAPGHHFGDKKGMLTAFAIEGFKGLRQHMERRRDEAADPLSRAAAVGLGYLEFALRNPEYFRVMFRAELLNERDPEYQAANAAAYGVLQEAVREGHQAVGIVDHPMLPQLCLLAWASVHGFATLVLEGAIAELSRSKKARVKQGLELGQKLILLLGPALFQGTERDGGGGGS